MMTKNEMDIELRKLESEVLKVIKYIIHKFTHTLFIILLPSVKRFFVELVLI